MTTKKPTSKRPAARQKLPTRKKQAISSAEIAETTLITADAFLTETYTHLCYCNPVAAAAMLPLLGDWRSAGCRLKAVLSTIIEP